MTRVKCFFLFFLLVYPLNSAHPAQGAFYDERWLSERTGEYIPGDIALRDENGVPVNLKSLINKPAILTLVYYRCSHVCPQVLGGLAGAIPKLRLTPGKDYKLITISFDPEDTSETARGTKNNYITAINKPFPPDAWKFLVGNKENIRKITNAVGFAFQQDMHGFVHPSVLIILSPEGKISGYLHVSKYVYGTAYPVTFSPYDLDTELKYASQGKIVTGVTTPLLFCFPHEPTGQQKFFDFLSVTGIATLVLMIMLFVYLKATTKSTDKRDGGLGK
jgi:protein SCO1/2